MKAMLISLVAATAVAAAIVWTPLPGGWADADAPAGGGSPPAPAAVTAPASVQASAAAAHIQFAADTAADPDAPPGAAAAAAPPPRPPPGPPVLVGVTEGAHRFAYVLNDGQTTRAALWDKVGKWRVTAIGPHDATLSAGGRTLKLSLFGPRPPPPPAATVDASASPPASDAAPPPAPPRARALEPASAPSPRGTGGHRPHYWAGPADRAPPGYIVLKPGEAPPAP